ncbi:efflux RND transporter periplasmic adaptor subunit [Portibacter lacus]|uniref:Efflux RND transporter periplasmic adaptor subunit n=1 Tax=Portibacter lacus TaxID=1099794 RepID=A0AA37WFW6_9BACT|nr:efflux RND transporter periplasmic adaptor subunit [Portibacter lacus]GLR17340.1 hypothetical protein GCM10007940_19550 [Portibacter lacus]
MNNYKIYIIGGLMLIAGILIGWLLQPSPAETVHDHSTHSNKTETGDGEEIWTCSMHPQIRQNEPGLCPICEMDLIPLDNSLGSDDPTILKMSKASAKLAQIQTTIVGSETAHGEHNGGEINVDGTIEIDQRSINTQTAHLPGRIESMLINFEGEYVKAGQKIASLYSTDLIAASQELITAADYDKKVAGLKEASIQKLKNWKISDAQIASILSSGQPIETIDIYADHSGYVLSKKVSQGDYLKQGQVLYTIGQTGSLWLIFNVFESDLENVRKGQVVNFTTPSVSNMDFNAKITYIDPLLNPTTRTATIRAEITSKGGKLKPGMLLKGKIKINNKSNESDGPLSVPSSAVLWTGAKSVVYVKMQDTEVPSFQYRSVEVSGQSGGMTFINAGLEIGEEIVTNGAFAVDAAAQLNNNASMMNQNVSIKKTAQSDLAPSFVNETSEEFKDQLDQVVQSYIALKDALVDTDPKNAQNAAESVLKSLNNVDMNLVKGEAHMYWMEQNKAIKAHGAKISESEDVEDQRSQFKFLSDAIINSLRAFGTHNHHYYVQYCPMVSDNKGADWVSAEKEIRNPYFGDKMMKCGSVKLEL